MSRKSKEIVFTNHEEMAYKFSEKFVGTISKENAWKFQHKLLKKLQKNKVGGIPDA